MCPPGQLTKATCSNSCRAVDLHTKFLNLFFSIVFTSMSLLKTRESLGLLQTEVLIATKLTLVDHCLHLYQIYHLKVQPRRTNLIFRYSARNIPKTFSAAEIVISIYQKVRNKIFFKAISAAFLDKGLSGGKR